MNQPRRRLAPSFSDVGESGPSVLSAAELDFAAYRLAAAQARKRYAFVPSAAVVGTGAFAYEALLAYDSPRYRPLRRGRPELPADAVAVSNHDLVGIAALSQSCACALGVTSPKLYVSNLMSLPIMAWGDAQDHGLVLARSFCERLSASALRFALGQGLGRVHFYCAAGLERGHRDGDRGAVAVGEHPLELQRLHWLPLAWAAQITADRAGLLCTASVAEAVHALWRIEQFAWPRRRTGRRVRSLGVHGQGRVRTQPQGEAPPACLQLDMRVEMLHLFAESRLFRAAVGESGGTPLAVVDGQVAVRLDSKPCARSCRA